MLYNYLWQYWVDIPLPNCQTIKEYYTVTHVRSTTFFGLEMKMKKVKTSLMIRFIYIIAMIVVTYREFQTVSKSDNNNKLKLRLKCCSHGLLTARSRPPYWLKWQNPPMNSTPQSQSVLAMTTRESSFCFIHISLIFLLGEMVKISEKFLMRRKTIIIIQN